MVDLVFNTPNSVKIALFKGKMFIFEMVGSKKSVYEKVTLLSRPIFCIFTFIIFPAKKRENLQ